MKKTIHAITREEQANFEVGHTAVSSAVAWSLVCLFLALISVVPLVQAAREIRESWASHYRLVWPRCADIFGHGRAAAKAVAQGEGPWTARILPANRELLRNIKAYEDRLSDTSWLGAAVRPWVQYALCRMGAGNEQVLCGRGTELFYRPDVEHLTGPGFLSDLWQQRRIQGGDAWRSAPQPDPVPAIIQFSRQLADRGIRLVLMPVPCKPALDSDRLTMAPEGVTLPLRNLSHTEWAQRLRRAGVSVFDPAEALARAGKGPFFLVGDTHWTPEVAERCARWLAQELKAQGLAPPGVSVGYQSESVAQTHVGDLAALLKLPLGQTRYGPETVRVRRILTPDGLAWEPTPTADTLVLGDSFCNIYSQSALGWGTGAGFVEQLSYEWQRPLDRIALNDNGAFATREALAHELAQGRDRLAGKRLVIWQFAERELSCGDWKAMDLQVQAKRSAAFGCPPPGQTLRVSGVIKAMTHAPRPGSVPYKDHIIALHLVDVQADSLPAGARQILAYVWSMRENVWTDVARARVGDRISLSLVPWSEVDALYEGVNRSDLEDESLLAQPPCWGEWVMP